MTLLSFFAGVFFIFWSKEGEKLIMFSLDYFYRLLLAVGLAVTVFGAVLFSFANPEIFKEVVLATLALFKKILMGVASLPQKFLGKAPLAVFLCLTPLLFLLSGCLTVSEVGGYIKVAEGITDVPPVTSEVSTSEIYRHFGVLELAAYGFPNQVLIT